MRLPYIFHNSQGAEAVWGRGLRVQKVQWSRVYGGVYRLRVCKAWGSVSGFKFIATPAKLMAIQHLKGPQLKLE